MHQQKHMNKPSVSKRRATIMAILAAFIACHPAMGFFNLAATGLDHIDKLGRIDDGTYSIGTAVSASITTFFQGMAAGWFAFLFTLPIALFFGLSTHAFLVKSGFWAKRHYALAGAFMGTVAYIYFIYGIEDGASLNSPSSWDLLLGAFTGLVAAFLFRLFMGNKGTPDGAPATWHRNIYETSQLPTDMTFKRVVLVCISSGILLLILSMIVSTLATLMANIPTLVLSPFGSGQAALGTLSRHFEGFFHPIFLMGASLHAILISAAFTAIYIVLRRIKKTGWIAFAIAGFIAGPLVNLLTSMVSAYVNYGAIILLGSVDQMIEAAILNALAYTLTAIIFRLLLGRYGVNTKGRNVSAPAS